MQSPLGSQLVRESNGLPTALAQDNTMGSKPVDRPILATNCDTAFPVISH